MERITDATIANWFTAHPPTPEQVSRYQRVNDSCKALCELILEVCPEASDDRDSALRTLRRLRMDINLTIACERPKL
jgi:hypothetical protein